MSHKFAELVKHHDYLNHAVFVVGSGRSGTTLIQSLLDGHPQLLVWPEEYGYYTIWNDYFPNSQKGDRYQGQVLRKCLLRGSGAKDFGKEHNAGQVSKPYSMKAIDAEVFHACLRKFDHERLSRKEFLQLLLYCFHQAYDCKFSPDAFVVKINRPYDQIFEDFPDARIIFAARHPVATYDSIKRFYFKVKCNNPWAAYQSANRRFRWGLLETGISPVLHAYEWLDRHRDSSNLFVAHLESIQANPERVMSELASFLGIEFNNCLTRPSMLGNPYGSNLSSGADTEGRIVRQQVDWSRLTSFELRWLSSVFETACRANGYDLPLETLKQHSALSRFSSFWKPLNNELLGISYVLGGSRRDIPKRFYHFALTYRNYMRNRLYMLLWKQLSDYRSLRRLTRSDS